MTIARPTPSQERWLLLATRHSDYAQAEILISACGGWRSVGFITRCAFFLLGVITAAAASGLLAILLNRHFAIPAGVLLMIAGEYLIRSRRLFSSGIEEALLAASYLLIACGLIYAVNNFNHETSLFLVVTLALLLTGLRLLNPVFIILAATVCVFAVSSMTGHRLFYGSNGNVFSHLWTSGFCYAIAVMALALGAKQFQRPGYDRMLDWLVVVMPVIGYLWAAEHTWFERPSTQRLWQIYLIVAPICFASIAFFIALRRRKHAPFFTTMGCVACVAYELRHLTGMPLYGRLIVWGALILIIGTLAERWLRTPRNGISSLKLDSNQENILNVAEIAGTSLVTPVTKASAPEPVPTVEGGGGNFGGGGASGKF